jgi:AcrR family transcriptional regulator
LLAAATEYVLDNGVANLTLRPLAAALGVTITTLIRHFESKEALVEEICRRIYRQLLDDLRADPELADRPSVETLRALWRRWQDPRQARQFTFIFELYGLALRDPERYLWFTRSVVAEALVPLEVGLVRDGSTPEEARNMGTVLLAVLRGLHLDLAATHDNDRVDAAFNLAVERLLTPTQNSP